MSDPVIFDTASPRFGLPLLFAGQAQREIFVNEALSRLDALLHCSIEGTANTPPPAPVDGTVWRIGTAPNGDWAEQAEKIACRQSGQWLFVEPQDGMRAYDQSTGTELRYQSGWQAPPAVPAPSGGTVVDVQARASLANLIAALENAGLLSAG